LTTSCKKQTNCHQPKQNKEKFRFHSFFYNYKVTNAIEKVGTNTQIIKSLTIVAVNNYQQKLNFNWF
jgi:hypothetical protein